MPHTLQLVKHKPHKLQLIQALSAAAMQGGCRHAFGGDSGFLSSRGAELVQQGGEETHAALSQVGVQAGLDLLDSLAHKAQAGWQHPLKQLADVDQYQLSQHLHSTL